MATMPHAHRVCLLLLMTSALTSCLLPPSLHALTPEENAVLAPVLAPVLALFDGMVLMREGKPVQMSFANFAARVGKPGTTHIEERIHHPLIRIDHDLAVVWAPFDLLVDGRIDHCGTDLFNLVQQNGHWLIASIADTGRKTCSGH
jgi:hypothetical protein